MPTDDGLHLTRHDLPKVSPITQYGNVAEIIDTFNHGDQLRNFRAFRDHGKSMLALCT